MFILDQERTELVNTDNVACIRTDRKFVVADCINGKNYCLGGYENECRAKEVYAELIKIAFAPTINADLHEISLADAGKSFRASNFYEMPLK